MSISFQIAGNSADELIAEARKVFGPLFAGTPLPPMQEQPKRDEPAPVAPKEPEVIPPEPKKTKGKKDKEPETIDAKVEPKADEPKAEIPDIEALRAKLKTLGEANYDAVFPLLEKFGAKSASTVPEDKRADVIAEINKLLEAK